MAQVAMSVPRRNMKARFLAVMSKFKTLNYELEKYKGMYSSMSATLLLPAISIQSDGTLHPEYVNFLKKEEKKKRRKLKEDWREQATKLKSLSVEIKDEINQMTKLHSLLLRAEPQERVLEFEEVTTLNKVHMFSCNLAISCGEVLSSVIWTWYRQHVSPWFGNQ